MGLGEPAYAPFNSIAFLGKLISGTPAAFLTVTWMVASQVSPPNIWASVSAWPIVPGFTNTDNGWGRGGISGGSTVQTILAKDSAPDGSQGVGQLTSFP